MVAAGTRDVVLLDLDGVILDNDRYDEEWARLAPAAFGVLGGDPEAWAEIQEAAWRRVEDGANRRLRETPEAERPHPADWWRRANADWVEEACALAGVEAPASEAERVAVAESTLRHYFSNTRAAFPDTARAVARLAGRFELHMSSGNPAFVVETVLRQLDVHELIGRPFGSDLAGAYKQHGRHFYELILEALGVEAARVIVVDDLDGPLRAARALGALGVKIGVASVDCDLAIDTLADLPDALQRA